jgi:uncharacterized peroxidase-related enzyme
VQHHGAALRRVTDDPGLVQTLADDWRAAPIDTRLHALLAYAERLTNEPSSVRPEHLSALRAEGLSDEAILHACEIVCYFNFVNRLADGLGVVLEEDWSLPIIGRFPEAE